MNCRQFLPVTISFCVLFALLPGRARAQLAVSGPVPAQARTLETWYTGHMPLRFRTRGRVAVRELTDRQMAAYLKDGGGDGDRLSSTSVDDDGDIDGVYENDPPQITLRVPTSGVIDPYTFAHEYGHYVWFNILSRDDRHRYEAVYKRQRAAHHLVTRYAETSLEEGFAEAFSFFVNEPAILTHRDSASAQFLLQK